MTISPKESHHTLSIATVVKNNLPMLKKTINTLLTQNEKNFEYAIIDGQSTDNTKQFVLKKPKPASIAISEADSGIYDAMNKATRVCTGDFIQFLNAGDTLTDDNTLSIIIKSIPINADIIIFNYAIDGRTYKPSLRFKDLIGKTPCHQAIIYKRTYLLKNPFNEQFRYCADYFNLLNALPTANIHIADHVIINYDTNGVSSQPQARRRIRVERAVAAWESNLPFGWRIGISIYNLLRYLI